MTDLMKHLPDGPMLYALCAIALIAALAVFIVIWKKDHKTAYIIMAVILAILLYFNVNWKAVAYNMRYHSRGALGDYVPNE